MDQLMRRILVDHARAKHRGKRGGADQPLTLDEERAGEAAQDLDVLELDLASKGLAAFDERRCRIVELHYFGGLNDDETAMALDISPATVHRELRLAKAWLHREMGGSESPWAPAPMPLLAKAFRNPMV